MTPRYAHILIATDFSEASTKAVRFGAELAQRSGAEVTLAHVFDPSPYMRLLEPRSPEEAEQAMGGAARDGLERIVETHLQNVERVHTVALRNPSAAAALCAHAGDHDIDLVVMGTRGRSGIVRMLLGSCAARLVRHAPCDVLVVRGEVDGKVDHIAAPTDLSENGSAAIDAGGELHDDYSAKLSILHVLDQSVPVPSSQGFGLVDTATLSKQLEGELSAIVETRFEGQSDVSVVVRVDTSPSAGICTWAEENAVDLLVVSTHGRTGLSAMLIGSVAEHVVQEAPCPVLTVRQPVTSSEP
jgi:nucleotide-binding universal stress UspA family protein